MSERFPPRATESTHPTLSISFEEAPAPFEDLFGLIPESSTQSAAGAFAQYSFHETPGDYPGRALEQIIHQFDPPNEDSVVNYSDPNLDRHTRVLLDVEEHGSRALLTLQAVKFGQIPKRNPSEVVVRLALQEGLFASIVKWDLVVLSDPIVPAGDSKPVQTKIRLSYPAGTPSRVPPGPDEVLMVVKTNDEHFRILCERGSGKKVWDETDPSMESPLRSGNMPSSVPIYLRYQHTHDLRLIFLLSLTYAPVPPPTWPASVPMESYVVVYRRSADLRRDGMDALASAHLAGWREMDTHVKNECEQLGLRVREGGDGMAMPQKVKGPPEAAGGAGPTGGPVASGSDVRI